MLLFVLFVSGNPSALRPSVCASIGLVRLPLLLGLRGALLATLGLCGCPIHGLSSLALILLGASPHRLGIFSFCGFFPLRFNSIMMCGRRVIFLTLFCLFNDNTRFHCLCALVRFVACVCLRVLSFFGAHGSIMSSAAFATYLALSRRRASISCLADISLSCVTAAPLGFLAPLHDHICILSRRFPSLFV